MAIGAYSLEQYSMTAGLLLSFFGLLAAAVAGRRDILAAFKEPGLGKKKLIYPAVLLAVFLVVELGMVHPTQQLFFDDVINQAMAQQLLNSGQAWMCNYGTPSACYSGSTFHEPIGAAFNLAIGFALFGVQRNVAYAVGLFAAALSVMVAFLVGYLLFRNLTAALFSELLMALSPVLLVWAMPTQSDIYLMCYSLIAMLFLLVFSRKKSAATFTMALMSLALATYMKVDAFLLVPVLAVMYLAVNDSSFSASARKTYAMMERHSLDTRLLVILLLFVVAISPEFIYAANEAATGDYGAVGTIQNTCSNFAAGQVQGTFSLHDFSYNLCANLLFWIDAYQSQSIMQPLFFTILAIVGVGGLLLYSRNIAIALAFWFVAFFLLYTAFYAGAVIYGVDWRFMLSLVPPASLLGGFGCYTIVEWSTEAFRTRLRNVGRGLRMRPVHIRFATVAVILFVIAYSVAYMVPQLTVEPWNIGQANNARFYENMVYNYSHQYIPSGCIVFSYDPTLYNINGFAARQLSDIYNSGIYQNMSAQYGCTVVDYGYWCYTPNNLCSSLGQTYNMTPLFTDRFENTSMVYGFYLVKPKA